MTDVTPLLSALGQGAPHAASRLLPLFYAAIVQDDDKKLKCILHPEHDPGERDNVLGARVADMAGLQRPHQ
jgi:hypothetical protein